MIEIQGKRNTAIVYADKIDKETKTQIAELLREEAFADSKIRIMPDTHSGKGCVVGTTMTLSGRVIPSLVGVDIGCGMEVVALEEKAMDLPRLDVLIHSSVPCGSKIHAAPLPSAKKFDFDRLFCARNINRERAYRSIGSLGGGNHFIEVDRDGEGRLYLVIHSGSRQLGSDVAGYYKDQAYRYQCKKARRAVKSEYRHRDEEDEYFSKSERRQAQTKLPVNYERAVLEGDLFEQYIRDVDAVREFAELNRRTIADIITEGMDLNVKERFSCPHNYIEPERMILRKGAISARLGERVIIPLNMRDGALICTGLGNPEWNFSAPHGAGRACSRTDAKYAYSVEEFREQMSGIYTTTATAGSLDECPMAYKTPERIIEQIGETVTINKIIRPIYNFKSC